MNEIKIPELKTPLIEELESLKNRIILLKHDLGDAEGELPGFERVMKQLALERVELSDKARDVPQLYGKPLKDKEKEINKLEKLMEDKKKEIREIKGEINRLEREELPDLENKTYLPYYLELSRLFWELQDKAYKENNDVYDEPLLEINELITGKNMNRYKLISDRLDKNRKRTLSLNNCR